MRRRLTGSTLQESRVAGRTFATDRGSTREHNRGSLHHADDASSFVRTARADRSCSIASAAALMAAVTTR